MLVRTIQWLSRSHFFSSLFLLIVSFCFQLKFIFTTNAKNVYFHVFLCCLNFFHLDPYDMISVADLYAAEKEKKKRMNENHFKQLFLVLSMQQMLIIGFMEQKRIIFGIIPLLQCFECEKQNNLYVFNFRALFCLIFNENSYRTIHFHFTRSLYFCRMLQISIWIDIFT